MLEYGKGRCADQRGYAKLLIHLRSSHIDTMARIIHCAKLDKEAEGFDLPPLPGKLGQRIYQQISKEAWQLWLRHQTMLINENRLNMADARAQVSPVAGQGGRRAVWSTQTSAAQHRPVIGFTCSRNIRFKLGLLPICEARGVMRLANISNIRFVTFLASLAYRRNAHTF